MYRNYVPNQRMGFLTPFILGGITGGLVAPYFYNNRPNYYYYPYPYYQNYYYYQWYDIIYIEELIWKDLF